MRKGSKMLQPAIIQETNYWAQPQGSISTLKGGAGTDNPNFLTFLQSEFWDIQPELPGIAFKMKYQFKPSNHKNPCHQTH